MIRGRCSDVKWTPDSADAKLQWRGWPISCTPSSAAFMGDAELDVLAFMNLPEDHRAKIHSTNPLERVIGEIKRRTDVVGIFPNED